MANQAIPPRPLGTGDQFHWRGAALADHGAVVVLAAANLTLPPAEALDRTTVGWPPEVRHDMDRFRRPEDRRARLVGRLLLRVGLVGLGLEPDFRAWRRTPEGRPWLAGVPVDFNLSHARGLSVCALSREARLGVDVVELVPLDPSRYARAFTPAETRAVMSGRPPWRTMLGLWAAKEAVLKAAGQGFLTDPAEVEVLRPDPVAAGRTWHLVEVPLGPDHLAVLAADRPTPRVEVALISPDELIPA